MKTLIIAIIVTAFGLTGCKTTEHKSEPNSHQRFSQHVDTQGPITIETLQQNYPIFAVKRNYQPSAQTLQQLNQITTPTQITVFFGTWCHDSQREIPNLIKLKQALNNPNIQLELIALDREKNDQQGLAQKAGVEYTPTIVVSQNQKELGRIIEKTYQPIDQELLKILQPN